MIGIFGVLALVFLAGVILGGYALLAPKPAVVRSAPLPPLESWKPNTAWTAEAGNEFAGLAEAARCDLIFAVADLDDERSAHLLAHALDDPSDAVALAAAHALARRGAAQTVEQYARQHPGERSERLARTLELLN